MLGVSVMPSIPTCPPCDSLPGFLALPPFAVYELKGPGKDGKEEYFTKPWAMTTVMFLGMTLCLPLAYWEDLKKAAARRSTRQQAEKDSTEPLLSNGNGHHVRHPAFLVIVCAPQATRPGWAPCSLECWTFDKQRLQQRAVANIQPVTASSTCPQPRHQEGKQQLVGSTAAHPPAARS